MKKEHYHPGTCEATEWGKRYGKNLTPQSFDGPSHTWHEAKDKNWGPWSCCGVAANSPGCQLRAKLPPVLAVPASNSSNAQTAVSKAEESKNTKVGVGAYIQFLVNERSRLQVTGESDKCWILVGHKAKKIAEGKSWIWLKHYERSIAGLEVGERTYIKAGSTPSLAST